MKKRTISMLLTALVLLPTAALAQTPAPASGDGTSGQTGPSRESSNQASRSVHPSDAKHLMVPLLLVDAAALGAGAAVAFGTDFDTDPKGQFGRGLGTTMAIGFLGAPAVYWADGRAALGFGSAMLRIVAAPTGALFGLTSVCVFRDGDRGCVRDGVVGGAAVGWLIAAAVDDLGLSRLSSPTNKHQRWYGWQTAIPDVAGLAFGTALAITADGETLNAGNGRVSSVPFAEWLGIWLIGTVGAPIVHFAHGNWLRGLASGALRFVGSSAVGVGSLVAYCSAVGGEEGCSGTGFIWGLMIGGISVSAFDVLALSREPIEEGDAPVSIVPMPMDDGVGVGLHTRF